MESIVTSNSALKKELIRTDNTVAPRRFIYRGKSLVSYYDLRLECGSAISLYVLKVQLRVGHVNFCTPMCANPRSSGAL